MEKPTLNELGLLFWLTFNLILWTIVYADNQISFPVYYLCGSFPGMAMFLIGCYQVWDEIIATLRSVIDSD